MRQMGAGLLAERRNSRPARLAPLSECTISPLYPDGQELPDEPGTAAKQTASGWRQRRASGRDFPLDWLYYAYRAEIGVLLMIAAR